MESQRHPHFLHHPLGVVQNGTLVVTTNYHCRRRGLPKMGAPADFAALCPSMRFAGSDMVRYRAASRAWCRLFQSFKGVVVMKRSIDEAYLDLTQAVRTRIRERRLCTPMPHRDPASLHAVAQARHAAATALFQREEAALQERFGAIDADLLESSGTITAAVRASKSTDPISQLREQQRTRATNTAEEERMRHTMQLDPAVAAMTPAQVEQLCEEFHPTDFCRAQKGQRGPIELVPVGEEPEGSKGRKGMPGLRWRPWVGEVILSPEEEERDGEQEEEDGLMADGGAEDSQSSFAQSVLGTAAAFPPPTDFSLEDASAPSDDYLLCVGSQVAWEIRALLFLRMGLTTSAGIAPNPMLAKLASSLHKPNQQSVVRRSVARHFIAPIKLSKVSGFGPKASERVEAAGVRLVREVQARSYASLVHEFGDRFGQWLHAIGQGEDETAVEETGPPKSIGQSKRQRTQTEDERLNLLYWLASKLYERIVEDEGEYGRYPTSLALGWINMGTWDIISRRVTVPYLGEKADPVQFLYEAAIALLREHVPGGIPLRCLSLTMSAFVALPKHAPISRYFVRGVGEGVGEVEAREEKGVEAVPLTANPYVGPSFTARYRTAKALVKKKTAVKRLFENKERPRTIHDMVKGRAREGHDDREGKGGDDVALVEERERREEVEEKNGDAVAVEEDDIASLFGEPSLPSLPAPPRPPTPPQPPATVQCERCGQAMVAAAKVEHDDWHLAQSLQTEVRAADRARREADEELRRRARQVKRGSMDSFVRATPPPPPTTHPPRATEHAISKRKAPAGDIGSFFRMSN